MDIRSISPRQTYTLRQRILRPDFSVEACRFAEDECATSRHFGVYQEDKLVGIVTVLQLAEPETTGNQHNVWQIRAMATCLGVRGKGYGAALINAVEDYVRSKKAALIWFNARSGAVGFYQKQGYTIVGDEFEIVAVGPHFRMKKTL